MEFYDPWWYNDSAMLDLMGRVKKKDFVSSSGNEPHGNGSIRTCRPSDNISVILLYLLQNLHDSKLKIGL